MDSSFQQSEIFKTATKIQTLLSTSNSLKEQSITSKVAQMTVLNSPAKDCIQNMITVNSNLKSSSLLGIGGMGMEVLQNVNPYSGLNKIELFNRGTYKDTKQNKYLKYFDERALDFLAKTEIEVESVDKTEFIKHFRDSLNFTENWIKEDSEKFNRALDIILKDKKKIPYDFEKEFSEIIASEDFRELLEDFELDVDFTIETLYKNWDGIYGIKLKEILSKALKNIYELKFKIQKKVARATPLRFITAEYFDLMFTFKEDAIGLIGNKEVLTNSINLIVNYNEKCKKRFNKFVVFLN